MKITQAYISKIESPEKVSVQVVEQVDKALANKK